MPRSHRLIKMGSPAPHDATSQEEVLTLAAALQESSNHPLAMAVLDRLREVPPSLPVPEALKTRALPGRGVEGVVHGRTVSLGSTRMLREFGLEEGSLLSAAWGFEQHGRTVSWLVDSGVAVTVSGDSWPSVIRSRRPPRPPWPGFTRWVSGPSC